MALARMASGDSASTPPPSSSKKANIKSLIISSIECAICHENFVDPRSLPCLHTFCLRCVESIHAGGQKRGIASNVIECPQCRKAFSLPPGGGVRILPHNFLVESLLQQVASENYCSCHPDDLVVATRFCLTCNAYTCLLCELYKHPQHSCLHVDEATSHIARHVDADLANVESRYTCLRDEVCRLDMESEALRQSTEKLQFVIRRAGYELKRCIDRDVLLLVNELDSSRLKLRKQLQSERKLLDDAQRYLTQFRTCARARQSTRLKLNERVTAMNELHKSASEFLAKCRPPPKTTHVTPTLVFIPEHPKEHPKHPGPRNLVGTLLKETQKKRKASDSPTGMLGSLSSSAPKKLASSTAV